MLSGCPLAHDETISLLRRARAGDPGAEEELVVHNAALVKSIVRKYLGRGVEFEDLFQIGCLGLVKAIKNYDEAYNVRFSTYAVPMIAGEIKRFMRDDGMVKVSRSLKETAARAAAARERLHIELGRDPTVNEIAEAIEVEPGDLLYAMDASRSHVSLYDSLYDDDSGLMLIDRMSETPSDEPEVVDKLVLKELLGALEPRERQIIFLRYFKDKTQNEIATQMGISQVQVSRLEGKIIRKLREATK